MSAILLDSGERLTMDRVIKIWNEKLRAGTARVGEVEFVDEPTDLRSRGWAVRLTCGDGGKIEFDGLNDTDVATLLDGVDRGESKS